MIGLITLTVQKSKVKKALKLRWFRNRTILKLSNTNSVAVAFIDSVFTGSIFIHLESANLTLLNDYRGNYPHYIHVPAHLGS